MKPLEILSAIPRWSSATPESLLASPAWAMPCRLGERQCVMRMNAIRPADVMPLDIAFENEPHVLGIADSALFEDLHAIWPSRTEVPEPILIALVEKNCGPFLQLLENAVRRQLKIVGISKAPPAEDAACAQVSDADGNPLFSFTLDMSPNIVSTLGQLRNIDSSHASVRDETLPSETEYATFALPTGDISSFDPGDALLMPEIGTIPPRQIVDGRFVLSESGISAWKDEGMLRVCSAETSPIASGTLLDAGSGSSPARQETPAENTQLKLIRMGKTLATGHLCKIGDQHAFVAEMVNR